jgi:hypothetical protein
VAVVPVTVEAHERGLHLAERFALSVYDAMIVAAAAVAATSSGRSTCGTAPSWKASGFRIPSCRRNLRTANPLSPGVYHSLSVHILATMH